MQTKKRSIHKKLSAIVAAVVVVSLLLAGTFAWTRLANKVNEFDGTTTPGAELRDDFNPNTGNKDVYVENTGDVEFYTRVMLNEYMEIYNALNDQYQSIKDSSYHATTPGTGNQQKDVDKDHWTTHAPDATGEIADLCDEGFHTYWEWKMGGTKNTTLTNTGTQYTTPTSEVMTYKQWVDAERPAETWVLCEDGYFYYSSLVQPKNTTGLLLDAVNNILKPTTKYYYAIDVVMEVATSDDLNAWLDGTTASDQTEPSNKASDDAVDVLTGLSKVPATGIKISGNDVSIKVGDTKTLSATLTPAGTTDLPGTLEWISSNPSVASVDATGKITAKSEGTTTITVKGKGFTSDPITVTVSTTVVEPDVVLDVKPSVINDGLGFDDDLDNSDPTLIYPNRSVIVSTDGATVSFWASQYKADQAYCWFKLSDLFTDDAKYNPELLEISGDAKYNGKLAIVEKVPGSGEWYIRSAIYPSYSMIPTDENLQDATFKFDVTISQEEESVNITLLHKYDGMIL